MKKLQGITESIWAGLPEDNRVSWKMLSRLVALVGAFFVHKTGVTILDWVIGAMTAGLLLIFIESQRSYTKLSPKYRKRVVRVGVALGTSSIVLLGLAYFLQAGLIAAAPVFSNSVLPGLDTTSPTLEQALPALLFLVAVPLALVRVFRHLQFEDLIYQMPKRGLTKLLVRKQPKAQSFSQFALIELTAMLFCLLYASTLAELLSGFIKLFEFFA
ncbi:hypothetical protein [Paucibacter sp. M5-1]|uniref:hypothetical protein n=1 Tax=Paucibacter sp. M5-1 TaxID=3015998 RepID=UPI0022B8F92C|nr:hypothetical protein [Paucibacter sp. M5-1]MCZ7881912.1 hypothetical protein [Paucibacter sp. M5-1]